MLGNIICILFISSLIFVLVKPEKLKFILKKPTRLKGLIVWAIFITIIGQIYFATPEYKAERLQENKTYNYYSKPDTTTKYPIWDFYRLNPIKDTTKTKK